VAVAQLNTGLSPTSLRLSTLSIASDSGGKCDDLIKTYLMAIAFKFIAQVDTGNYFPGPVIAFTYYNAQVLMFV
jgi:hypothetical protein